MSNTEYQQQQADRLALPMFVFSLLFLVLVAVLIVDSLAAAGVLAGNRAVGMWAITMLLLIWPIFIIEYLYGLWLHRSEPVQKQQLIRAVVCFIPPLRLAAPCRAKGNKIWLPNMDWCQPGRQLSQQLAHKFGKPMLIIALLILPILLLEYGLREVIERNNWLMMLMHFSTGFIWCAFAFEFIIMISASDKKIAYVKKNWIDLAIILLPLISFLRSVRVLRLARLAKVQKLAKLGRVYRMRGLGMKALRALLLLQFINRLIGMTPEKKLRKLQQVREEKLAELSELEEDIHALEESIKING